MAGRSRGFGILRFATPELGQRAISEMQNYQIDSRPIQVREDREIGGGGEGGGGGGRRGRGSSGGGGGGGGGGGDGGGGGGGDACTVFVGNLAWGTTDDDLLATFQQTAGAVVSAHVQIAPSGRSKGWGLVKYSSPAETENAVTELNNTMLHERRLTVRLDRK
ncbi:unnamed protein product [Ectocarpus sp. 12 AP-2014]